MSSIHLRDAQRDVYSAEVPFAVLSLQLDFRRGNGISMKVKTKQTCEQGEGVGERGRGEELH